MNFSALGNNLRRHRHQHKTTTENLLLQLLKQCPPKKQLIQQIQTQMLINSTQQTHNFLLSKTVTDLKDYTFSYTLFKHIPQPNDYSFNIMMRGLAATWHKHSQSLEFYRKMRALGVMPNNFTYPFVFMSCGVLLDVVCGKCGHGLVFKVGVDLDCHVSHSLITMYAKFGSVLDSRKVFDEIPVRDLVSWNSMISGYVKLGFAKDAVSVFVDMRENGFLPDEMTVVSVLVAVSDLGNIGLGREIENFVIENNMVLNAYMGSALISMYSKCGDLASARRVFDSVERKKDIVIWNAMITGYAQNGFPNEAITLFKTMREVGPAPDKITLVEVLSSCALMGSLELGKLIEQYAVEQGVERDVYVGSTLIDMYAKCGKLDDAYRVFKNMPHKNEVSWNSMISALAFNGRPHEALNLFKHMQETSNIRPSDVTFIAVLSACVHAGLVDDGRNLFWLMKSVVGLVPKIEHYSCMVDLLARAGHLYEAWDLIEKMPGKPDEITLGALLGACQKSKNLDVSERVMKLLLEIAPSNSGNYIISSRIYAKMQKWDDSSKLRVLMRERGVSKTPGLSWIDVGGDQVHEFHAGDCLGCESMGVYWLLNEEMRREGYTPEVEK